MTIGQIFILSPRGDTIINKDYRGDALPNMHEVFFRKVKFWDKSDAPPVFQIEDVTYIYIKRNSLIIACTTRFNVSPSATIELLNRMAKVFKDYCGILTEESIRKNFILVYELLDEMMDFGYPQVTSTEMLKSCVHNEAVLVKPPSALSAASSMLSMTSNKTKASSAANIPITMLSAKGGSSKNEIYVDIVERLTVLFNSSGYVVILDDCNFHECVHLDEFESSRTLHFLPPDGEFSESGTYKIDMQCILRSEIPDGNYGSNVVVKMSVPRCTVSVVPEFGAEMPGCAGEYNHSEKKVIWTIRKFVGGSEITLRAKITIDQPVTASHKKEIGPISMSFEIPMYNVSHLQVRYLRISETHKSYNPCRWVRYITQSSSYVCRL
eukprot:gene32368-41938_t